MNTIDKLIEELCPDGVEYVELGKVGSIVRGNGMPKTDFSEQGVGCIHYGQIYTHYGTWAEQTISFVPADKATKLAKVDTGDIVITNTSENLDDVCKAVAWLGDHQIVTGGHACVFKHSQNAKYLAYYMQTPEFHDEKRKLATGTKVIDVSAKNLARIPIPLPPLPIQHEIVKILDTFSQLEAELEAELEARRLQYRHYRDELLTFGDGVETKMLSEIGVFTRGKRFVKNDITPVGVPCIHYGEMYTRYTISAKKANSFLTPEKAGPLRKAQPNDVIIVAAGETIEDLGKGVAWLGDDEVVIHDACFTFRHTQNPVFIAYFLETDAFRSQIRPYVSSGKISSISALGLGKARIPIPPLTEQQRIVDILDKFDALVNDLSSGLPAEIAARRQQYEHYRDRLLTFKEKK